MRSDPPEQDSVPSADGAPTSGGRLGEAAAALKVATRPAEAPATPAADAGRPGDTAPANADAAAKPARQMMRQYELVERVASYNPGSDEALLNRAYVYSMRKHGHQTRASGDPYFSHPLEVAAILTGMRLDDASIATALLHDVIEDTDATRAEIDKLFGNEIGKLVDGLTKIAKLDLVNVEDKQSENLRKLFLAVADDVRVLLVKLADRLHNMRTLKWVPPHKRTRIAEETMDVYAPLAGRMGIQWMREELEHLAFGVLFAEEAVVIEKELAKRREALGARFGDIEAELAGRLAENGIDATVSGREKRPYSIYQKMQRKLVNFESLSDIYGFRVIVDTPLACYKALGVIHTSFKCVPGRFKDYISLPKQNDYRSLHTTVIGLQDQRVELQIRTHEMHRFAEYGVAAHALSKDGSARSMKELAHDSKVYAWLRQTVEQLSDEGNSRDFLHDTKLELFQDRVFCFTPKGKLIALPPGATPIDFAYQVHTQIGNSCTGCRINGHPKPLVTPLASGDEVEIMRKEGASPPAAWSVLAVTGKARAAIRKANKDADRRKFVRLGLELVENEMARRDLKGPLDFGLAAERLGFESEDALAHAIGSAERPASAVLSVLGYESPPGEVDAGRRHGIAVNVRGGRSDLPVQFSPKHLAIPGDGIIGILDPGKGVTVYPVHAGEALDAFGADPARWVEVGWDLKASEGTLYPVDVRLMVANETGVLAEIAIVIAEADSNIDELNMIAKTDDFREMTITLEVRDRAHLSAILDRLNALSVVSEASRAHA
ncbi:bifunctional (p)ppGpp synthetase/guanosine-3',5'-bis(diphosphate) 3'-pyrophosphohydrolase [Acuticoccus sp. MNP-M23]|uniref:RelA/SpoT family protein n=1 Tax=Acuticoccus sp. MNP-M23 TaxID=3072793 RepID=UPI0028161743|nr:bifunctional (p)ppGpp synthetase/guanosine-3',5'-bis(diphosphate) 3'-pyrophosphohydrolase [Acuticoccus sp. MNP-M23]WMS43397.1 bifunctional (p)ppGpp synthetase/guanosine-3',5'-bis(diphosphate) 3'-pyrophosphohydrolase [Acuticoccus sp. MNP-M23]